MFEHNTVYHSEAITFFQLVSRRFFWFFAIAKEIRIFLRYIPVFHLQVLCESFHRAR